MVKASHKWVKTSLLLGVKKFNPFLLALNLSKFPLFDKF